MAGSRTPTMSGPLVLLALMLLPVCVQAQSTDSGGLFPPVQFETNFVSLQPVEATSTCSASSSAVCVSPELNGCTQCNSSCPYGQDLPPFIDLLSIGGASSGIVRDICLSLCNIL